MSYFREIDQPYPAAAEGVITKGVTYITAAVALPEIARLEQKVNMLEKTVNLLRFQIEILRTQQTKQKLVQEIEELPTPSNKIKEEVASYLKRKGEAYPSDVADALGISLKEVLASILILKEEKKVIEADECLQKRRGCHRRRKDSL